MENMMEKEERPVERVSSDVLDRLLNRLSREVADGASCPLPDAMTMVAGGIAQSGIAWAADVYWLGKRRYVEMNQLKQAVVYLRGTAANLRAEEKNR